MTTLLHLSIISLNMTRRDLIQNRDLPPMRSYTGSTQPAVLVVLENRTRRYLRTRVKILEAEMFTTDHYLSGSRTEPRSESPFLSWRSRHIRLC